MTFNILLIVLPLLLAFLSIILSNFKKVFLYFGALLNVLLLILLEHGELAVGGFMKPFGITMVVDQYSYIGILLINILFFITVFSQSGKTEKYETILLTLLAGINGLLMTGDLFNLFVFLEITSIALYVLTTQSKKYYDTFHYIIIGSIGTGIYLIGVMMMYSQFGSLNLSIIGDQIQSHTPVLIPMLLIFVGISVETKLFPMNGWAKNIYKNANGLIGTLISSIVASVALLVMGRLLNTLFANEFLGNMVLGIAILTLVSGELAAFNGKSIREILLYSSIGQSGLITLLMVSGLYFPAVIMILNNAISKMIMFTIGDLIAPEETSLQQLKGALKDHKLLGLAFTTASFSLIGLPLFLGFYGKLNALVGLFSVHFLLPALILIITIVEGAYLIRLNITLWHPEGEGKTDKQNVHSSVVFAMCVLSIVLIIGGLFPKTYGEAITEQPLLDDQNNYVIEMKGGM